MRIGITGATGFVGEQLAKDLEDRGFEIVSYVRNPKSPSERKFSLGEMPDISELKDIDLLIHSAYDFSARRGEDLKKINVDGSKKLFKVAKDAGIQKVVFISSMAAFDEAKSEYGLGKLEVEHFVQENFQANGLCVRPGTIWSEKPRGLVGILKKLSKLPIVPYFTGNDLSLYLVHCEDLSHVIVEKIKNGEFEQSVLTVAHQTPVLFKDILVKLSERTNPIMFPIPSLPTLHFLKFIESSGFKFPFSSDSLVGLLNANRSPTDIKSDRCRRFV